MHEINYLTSKSSQSKISSELVDFKELNIAYTEREQVIHMESCFSQAPCTQPRIPVLVLALSAVTQARRIEGGADRISTVSFWFCQHL